MLVYTRRTFKSSSQLCTICERIHYVTKWRIAIHFSTNRAPKIAAMSEREREEAEADTPKGNRQRGRQNSKILDG